MVDGCQPLVCDFCELSVFSSLFRACELFEVGAVKGVFFVCCCLCLSLDAIGENRVV